MHDRAAASTLLVAQRVLAGEALSGPRRLQVPDRRPAGRTRPRAVRAVRCLAQPGSRRPVHAEHAAADRQRQRAEVRRRPGRRRQSGTGSARCGATTTAPATAPAPPAAIRRCRSSCRACLSRCLRFPAPLRRSTPEPTCTIDVLGLCIRCNPDVHRGHPSARPRRYPGLVADPAQSDAPDPRRRRSSTSTTR